MSSSNSLPILLVDDEASILKASSLMLQNKGFDNIITEQDSSKVMRLLASHPVAVAIIDLHMPAMSGRELLSQIATTYPDVVVIIQTALDETQS
ncbi:MAG TPA: response regulator, partial [Desulfuromonadaceae bacterium]